MEYGSSRSVLLVCVLLVAALLATTVAAQAEIVSIVDTGQPGGAGANYLLGPDNWHAAQFLLGDTTLIDNVQTYLNAASYTTWHSMRLTIYIGSRTFNNRLLPDTSNMLGQWGFSIKGVYDSRISSFPIYKQWAGPANMDLILPAGEYWASFEVRPGDTLPGGSIITGNSIGQKLPWASYIAANGSWSGGSVYSWMGLRVNGWTGGSGASQGEPIMPAGGAGGEEPWEFGDVAGDGAWFDPPMVPAYLYETDGLSNFTHVELPVGLDADGIFIVNADGAGGVAVAEGTSYEFPVPVDNFIVSGIDPAADADDPLGFPTFLQFDQTTVNFTMTGIPEPATMGLMFFGAMGMIARKRR